jgi:hypothetical protein
MIAPRAFAIEWRSPFDGKSATRPGFFGYNIIAVFRTKQSIIIN